jgi:hypothetical protein
MRGVALVRGRTGDAFQILPASDWTVGTAQEAEVSNETCPEGPGDHMEKTLWYTIEGDGGEVTIDTAGSNFDTVVAAYVLEDGAFVEVGCNDDPSDDDPSLGLGYQARLTLPTEEGVTYLIQVGGWLGDYGRLRLAVR